MRRLDWRVVTLAALALTQIGQADPLAAIKYSEPVYGEPVGGCRLGIAAPREPMRAGDQVRIEVWVEHLGDPPPPDTPHAKVPLCSVFHNWQTVELRLVDERGQDVPQTRMGRRPKDRDWMRSTSGSDARPGQARPVRRFDVSLLVDMTLAGRYRARLARRVAVPSAAGPQGTKLVLLASGELAFELVEPPGDG